MKKSLKKPKLRLKWKFKVLLPVVFFTLFLLVMGLFFNSFAIDEGDKLITFTSNSLSYENSDPGSWKVEKSIEWIGKQSARITFDVNSIMKTTGNYRDIILVIDISENMSSTELEKVKTDLCNLVNNILSDSNNRIALLTTESDTAILSGFTNNKSELSNQIQNLTNMKTTNYYQTLVNIDTILSNYTRVSDRECEVLILTDGYPNEDISNNAAQYKYLKNQYDYLTISGVQYGIGTEVLETIKEITDIEYSTNLNNLSNTLIKAASMSVDYDSFVLTDYINSEYFEIESVNQISASNGIATLEYEGETPKVIWNISDYGTGFKESLTIDINLKDELVDQGGNYATNIQESVYYSIGGIKETVTSNLTPVLEDNYIVQYDSNSPSDCTASNIPDSFNKSVYQIVEISNSIPVCEGYQFKGWQLITEGTEVTNNDFFIMPESNVILRAEWGQNEISKSLDGTVMPATPATATSPDILEGKTAWVDGIKLTGTMPNRGSVVNLESDKILLEDNNVYLRFPAGYYSKASTIDTTDVTEQYITYDSLASILNLTAEKIVSGQTILGITGTYTADATATSSDILSSETAYANGTKITGTITNKGDLNWTATTGETKTVEAGYYTGGTLDSSGTYAAGYNAALNGKTLKMLAQGGTSISYTATEPMVVVIGGWIGGLSGKTNNVTASVTRASTGTTTTFSRTTYDKGSNKGAGSYVNEVVSLETGDKVSVSITTTSSANNLDTWIIGYN